MPQQHSSPDFDLALIERLTHALYEATRVHCRDWPLDDGDLNAAEGVRQSLRLMIAGALCFLESDPAYPMLLKQQSPIRQMQLPSADAVYHYARLHGDHAYRIRGGRGTAHVFQISIWNGSCSNLRDYRLVSKQDNLEHPGLAPGLEVDLVLSREPREEHWLALPPGECEIYVRQYYLDWDRERPAMLTIEREGARYPPPLPTRGSVEQGMNMVTDWLKVQSEYFRKSVRFHLDASPTEVPLLPIPEAFQDNRYLCGHYRCQRDQAVLLEVRPPAAVYWGFQLANLQWEAMDYHQRQTSLNAHQATLDLDGVFRAVISHEDPGVPNWLDTGGRTLGLISGRYYKAADAPIPKLTTIPLAGLAWHLPPATPRVAPAERQAALRRRLQSVSRRLCTDQ